MRIVRRRLGAALVGLGVCLAGGLPSAQPARAATIRQVPADYATIQQAIDAAAPGDTVRVGAGEYDERLSVTKSVVIESVAGAATTVVVGDGSGPTVSIDVEAAETAVLRGFTIKGGHATHGGGVRVSGAGGAVLTRNVVTANSTTSDGFGGGIYTNATGSVRIEANNVFGNTAGNGGGLAVVDPLDTLIVNNLITGNTAGGSGGGVNWWTSGPENDPAFVSNTIAGNDSDVGAAVQGSGVQAGVTLRDNVLAANMAAPLIACYGTGGPPALYTHNVLWNGQWGIWQGLCENAANSGNVEVDPRFADPDHGDYHLRADSPLIDAATADPDVTTDVDGDARPFDGDESGSAANDVGADEATDSMLIAPGGVDFGEVPMVGTQHASIVVGNLGTTPMSVAAASLGGDNPGDFSVDTADCVGATLAVGDTCTIDAAVTPTAAGYRAAIIELSGPAPVGTRRIILDAQVMDPLRITGGYQGATPIGSTVTMPFNVYNSGTDPVSIDELGIVGPAAGDYGIDAETCTDGPLPGGSSCVVTVHVRPTLVGLRAATLTLTGPFPVDTREIALQVSGSPSAIDLSWGTTTKAGPAYTWAYGNAFARTVQSGTQRLHQAFATDRVGGTWVKDTGGPYAGIYYTRSTSGSTWSTPKRINPTSSHAIRFGIAAAGTRVYVAYVTQTRVYRYSPTAPRVLYVRTNTSHGSTTSWKPAIRLTSLSSRVDYPTIAATGDDVHVAWTNSNTGDVFVATSRDRGVTWTTRKVGSTTQSSTSGKAGVPSIAASGATVAVAWKSDRNTLRTRVSTDHGSHWGTSLETFNVRDTFSVAARGSRVAVAFWGYDGFQVMTRVNGSWGPARVVQDPGDFSGYSVSVALQDADRVGVAYSMEMGAETWAELWWTESTDNGVNWYLPQTVASSGSSLRRTNDWPTVIWPTAGTRFVSWSGWTVDTSNYRMYLRQGSGTAASLTFLAPVTEPGVAVAATPPDPGGTRRDSIERH